MSDADPLREQLAALPSDPGVYVFRDRDEHALYVGKAKSLRRRVLSYFAAPLRPDADADALGPKRGAHPKIAEMVRRAVTVEVLVTASESEALILEGNLVKRYRPPFNMRLRDDKSYPYIGISLDEDFPRVYFTRERHRRDRVYFGPFSSAYKVRDTLNLINTLFPNRPCEGPEPGRPSGIPCLDYHIKRCLAPCVGYITKDEYAELIDQTIAFLSGRYRRLEGEIEEQMQAAAAAQQFERAAVLRDRLSAISHLRERQSATSASVGSADVLGVAAADDTANVQVLQVRDGVLQDRQSFFVDAVGAESDLSTLVEQFALEYYSVSLGIPPLVVVPQAVGELAALEAVLSERRGSAVEVRPAERGEKRRLAEMATNNARLTIDQERERHQRSRMARHEALAELAIALDLPAPPARIECFDISNLGETYAVASMVVFEDGRPASAQYRSFTMRYEGGQNDFARMSEALERRGRRLAQGPGQGDTSFAARPGLIVIDGGKGQLAAALEGLGAAGVGDVPIVSLAKQQEEVFRPHRPDPVLLPIDSPALLLLRRVRDEAHRFALRHHRRRRGAGMTASIFDSLPGVGPARRRAILTHFGSPDRFLEAGREELEAVPGLPPKVARDVYDRLHKVAAPDQAAGAGRGR